MEKIIFIILAVAIMGFLLFLGISAISKGFKAINENTSGVSKKEDDDGNNIDLKEIKLTDELVRLNELFQNGVLTQEEFEKKKKNL